MKNFFGKLFNYSLNPRKKSPLEGAYSRPKMKLSYTGKFRPGKVMKFWLGHENFSQRNFHPMNFFTRRYFHTMLYGESIFFFCSFLVRWILYRCIDILRKVDTHCYKCLIKTLHQSSILFLEIFVGLHITLCMMRL